MKSIKKIKPIKLKQEDIRKIERKARRDAMLDLPANLTTKAFKNKKKYNRKTKHRNHE
jgi:hypothetical protein